MELQWKGFTPMPRKARSAEPQVAGKQMIIQKNRKTTILESKKLALPVLEEQELDAAGLSSIVEDVFASGDLPRAAETLANMRHCLSAVGEVAEFANIRKQLEVLEDRLDSMVQPRHC
ncbi:hypothetical protein L6164_017947 [Bauhinia variegata]|uniref:Uncharacterized protein n=1 Tax=Bauhinia variegata TaxID=167791 RepID=A0ACB9NBD7_BAUVA|nr:hypothetical protein L6164_017947 [Bauhinia variegata]